MSLISFLSLTPCGRCCCMLLLLPTFQGSVPPSDRAEAKIREIHVLHTWLVYATAFRQEADAYMFCRCFFLFFSVRQKYETTVLGNGWTDFRETFTKRYRGKCSLKVNVVPPHGESRAAAWRMANVDDLRNLRYDSFAITTHQMAPRTAVALYNHERANGCNLGPQIWQHSKYNLSSGGRSRRQLTALTVALEKKTKKHK